MATSQQNKEQKERKNKCKEIRESPNSKFLVAIHIFSHCPSKQRLIVDSIYDIAKVRLPFLDIVRKKVRAHKNDVMGKRNCKTNQVKFCMCSYKEGIIGENPLSLSVAEGTKIFGGDLAEEEKRIDADQVEGEEEIGERGP